MYQSNTLNKKQNHDKKELLQSRKLVANPLSKLSEDPNKVQTQAPSSTTLEDTPLKSIEKENKAKEKKEAAAEAMRTRCKICFKETSPNKRCSGHGGGGGKGEAKSADYQVDSLQPVDEKSAKGKGAKLEEVISGFDLDEVHSSAKGTDDELLFDLERMMELFSFINDIGRGILTIRAKPGYPLDDEKEMQRYLEAIHRAFNEIKKELAEEGVPVEDFVAIANKNELIIRVPEPKYYDYVMQELFALQLLPKMSPKLDDEEQHVATPTPFAQTPSPSVGIEEDADELQKSTRLSPFSIVCRPKDLVEKES